MGEEKKKEGIRAWYQRTTRRSMRGLTWATIACVIGMAAMWSKASLATLQHLQTFNGALSVPLLGGIWIFFFIFGFLIPSREASFRGQEAIEEGVELFKAAIVPWNRIADRIEAQLNAGLLDEVKSAVKELREAAVKIHEGNGEVKKFTHDMRPVVEKLKKIQERLDDNFLRDLHDGARALRMLGQPLPPPASTDQASRVEEDPVDAPQVGKALSMVRKKADKNGGTL